MTSERMRGSEVTAIISDQQPPERSGGRFAGLDGYRAVAALLLVVFHTYLYSREGSAAERYVYEGAPADVVLRGLRLSGVFFLLAGFLIFLPFARAAVSQSGPRSVRAFLINRAIRILPAYYVVFLLVWAWRYAGLYAQWVDLAEHLTFTHVFDSRYIFWTVGPAWTIAIEAQFYMVVALLGPIAYRACSEHAMPRERLRLLTTTVATLGIASVLFKWWAFSVAHIPQDHYAVYFGLVAKLDIFALGMLLALLVIARERQSMPLLRGIMPLAARLVGLGAIVTFVALRPGHPAVELFYQTLVALAFLPILASTVLGPSGSRWERMVGLPLLTYLATISYSIYLWHEPILVELGKRDLLISRSPERFPTNALVLVACSVLMASVGYALVQKPTMLLRHLFTRDGRLIDRYREGPPGAAHGDLRPVLARDDLQPGETESPAIAEGR